MQCIKNASHDGWLEAGGSRLNSKIFFQSTLMMALKIFAIRLNMVG